MTSALGKMALIGETAVHELLDKIIDLNSIGALRTHVRRLEDAITGLREARASELGNVRTYEQDIEALKSKAEKTQRRIDLLLSDDIEENDAVAEKLAATQIGREGEIKRLGELAAEAQERASQIEQLLDRLDTKHTELMGKLRELETLDQARRHQERATKAIRQVQGAIAASADVSVDDVGAKIRAEANKQAVLFEELMGDMGDEVEDEAIMAEARDRIAQRKAELMPQEEGGGKEAVPAASEAPAS